MGCFQSKGRSRIVAMQTFNQDQIFTSTTDIHTLYSFGKVIGIGSFGKVVVARRKCAPHKHFAIKVIDKRTLKSNDTMLANEIYVLQQLDHPNVIKFYEVYQSELYFYICMDYCRGGELVERIARHKSQLNEKSVQLIMSKVFSAVAYIHEQGIVHRDIKPENVIFTDKDLLSEPKLIDFGLANKFDLKHLKKLKTVVGTPLYMPPEVIQGDYDEKCDIWSLGVLLYSVLCGYPPFKGRTKETLYEKIKTQPIIFDSKSWKALSSEVKDLLKRMLNKDPKSRYSAKDCLRHTWFKMQFPEQRTLKARSTRLLLQKFNKPENDDERTVYEMLKNFRAGSKFKKEVTKVLINQMNEYEIYHLKKTFNRIDVDNSGTITIDELRQALIQEGSPASEREIQKLIETVLLEDDEELVENENEGRRKTLVIKYSDFLAACVDERKVLTREKVQLNCNYQLWSLFKYFDTQNVNYIQKEDIKEAFARCGKSVPDKVIEEMIWEIDPNHDNRISFEEFCSMMGAQGIEQSMSIRDEDKENNKPSPDELSQ